MNTPKDKPATVESRTVAALTDALLSFGLVEDSAAKIQAEAFFLRLAAAGVLRDEEPELEPVAISLTRTSLAVPEQYDVFRDGRQIGYLRLRHGHFRAHYPDHTADDSVYETGVRGDGFFYDDEERARELHAAAVELLKADGVSSPAPQFEIPPYDLEQEDEDGGILFEILAKQKKERDTADALRKQNNLELLHADLTSLLTEALANNLSADELIEQLEAGGFIAEAPRLSLAGRDWDPTELKPKSFTVVLQPGEILLRAEISDFGPSGYEDFNQIVGTFVDIAGENVRGMIRYKDLRESAEVNELFNGYEANELVMLELKEY